MLMGHVHICNISMDHIQTNIFLFVFVEVCWLWTWRFNKSFQFDVVIWSLLSLMISSFFQPQNKNNFCHRGHSLLSTIYADLLSFEIFAAIFLDFYERNFTLPASFILFVLTIFFFSDHYQVVWGIIKDMRIFSPSIFWNLYLRENSAEFFK